MLYLLLWCTVAGDLIASDQEPGVQRERTFSHALASLLVTSLWQTQQNQLHEKLKALGQILNWDSEVKEEIPETEENANTMSIPTAGAHRAKIFMASDGKSGYIWSLQVCTRKLHWGASVKNEGISVVLKMNEVVQGHNIPCKLHNIAPTWRWTMLSTVRSCCATGQTQVTKQTSSGSRWRKGRRCQVCPSEKNRTSALI